MVLFDLAIELSVMCSLLSCVDRLSTFKSFLDIFEECRVFSIFMTWSGGSLICVKKAYPLLQLVVEIEEVLEHEHHFFVVLH